MYTAKYKSKVPTSVNHAVPILYATQRHMKTHRSDALNRGTPERDFQFMTTHLTSAMEYHDTQAGGKVLGNKSHYASHKFWYVHASSFVTWQREHRAQHHPRSEADSRPADDQPHPAKVTYAFPSFDDRSDDYIDAFNEMEEVVERNTVYVVKADQGQRQVKSAPQHINYLHRDTYLAAFSPVEYNIEQLY